MTLSARQYNKEKKQFYAVYRVFGGRIMSTGLWPSCSSELTPCDVLLVRHKYGAEVFSFILACYAVSTSKQLPTFEKDRRAFDLEDKGTSVP